MTNAISYPKFRAWDSNDNPLVGGKLYSYEVGTSTLANTYSDSALSVPNANPVILDSQGEADVYISGSVKLALYDADDVLLWTVSEVQASTLWTFSPAAASVLYSSVLYGGTQAAIEAAMAAVGSTEATIYLAPDDWIITDTSTLTEIPTNVTLKPERGALITVQAGQTLNINGPLEAGLYQIFDCQGTGKVVVASKTKSSMRPEHWGAAGDGVTDDTIAMQAYATCMSTGTAAYQANFTPGQTYLISSTINFQMHPDTFVNAKGVSFTFTNNAAGFDLNPAFTAVTPLGSDSDAYTIRNVTWEGGYFTSTNATKTANNAIRAYFFRNIKFKDVKVYGGFYAAFKFGGKDTYRFIDCYTYDCTRHYWVPPEGTLYEAVYAANMLIDAEWRGCDMSVTGDEAGIYVEDTVQNLHVNGGNINGAATIAQVFIGCGTVSQSDTIRFSGTHFEQTDAHVACVRFDNTGTTGFRNVSFDNGCRFYSSVYRWTGVKLANCHYVTFGNVLFTDGASGAGADGPSYGVYVDSLSSNITFTPSCYFQNFMALNGSTVAGTSNVSGALIRIETTAAHALETGDRIWVRNVTGTVEANGMWLVIVIDSTHFDLAGSTYATPWVSGGSFKPLDAIVFQATADRKNVTMQPETVNLATPVSLRSYAGSTNSTKSETLNMSYELSEFIATGSPPVQPTYIWPKGYDLSLVAKDSNSAGATVTARVYSNPGSGSVYSGVWVYLSGLTNSINRSSSGYVPADTSGDIKLDVTASGAGTATIGIAVSAIRQ